MSLQKRFTSPYIWCVLLILFYSPDASLGFTIYPRRSCKNIYSTTSSLKESGDDKGGLNWDYDLWKEFDLRTRAKSNLQSLQGEQSVGGKLSIGQRIKLWLITTRVKLTPKESFLIKDWTLQNSLITINILLFLYQIQTSTLRHASLWQKIQQPTKSALAMDFLFMGRLAEKTAPLLYNLWIFTWQCLALVMQFTVLVLGNTRLVGECRWKVAILDT